MLLIKGLVDRWLRRLFRRHRTYEETVLADHPVGYWKLNDPPEHDPIAWDHSGNERHGKRR